MKKQFFIHVGPPKTGTSAVQKWMSENTQLLAQEGVYYPKHNTDRNGVSSGNLLSIYSRTGDGTLYLDKKKIEYLTSELINSKRFSKILLSSEFFFVRMAEIKDSIPNVTFICYFRNPMEKRESQYNQGVKRSNYTKKYPNKIIPKVPDLIIIKKFITRFGNTDLVITPYSKEYLYKNNILDDILHKLQTNLTVKKPPSEIINSSYQLEALEVKRWLNNFSIQCIHSEIDTCLQTFNNGTSSYSLLKPKLYNRQKAIDVREINKFFNKTGTTIPKKFINTISKHEQKKYFQQALNETQILAVFEHLHENLKDRGEKLSKIVKSEIDDTEGTYYRLFQRTFDCDSNNLLTKIIDKVYRK